MDDGLDTELQMEQFFGYIINLSADQFPDIISSKITWANGNDVSKLVSAYISLVKI